MRIVLALGRHQTMSEAGDVLNLSHSTISRRVQALQESLSTRLFEYHGKSWHLTAAGQDIFEIAQRMEDQVMTIDRALVGQDDRLAGAVRLSTVSAFAVTFGALFKQFTQEYPDIDLAISCTERVVNLSKREADVVLRVQNTPPEHLVGYRIGRLEYAVYVAESLLASCGLSDISPEEWRPNQVPWLAWTPESNARVTDAWMKRHIGDAPIACTVNDPSVMVEFVRQGVGAGAMMTSLFEHQPGIRRMTGLLPGFGIDLWLLTHEDLRHTARIKALMQFLRQSLNAQRPSFEGEGIPQEERWL